MGLGKTLATLVNASTFGLIDRKSVTGLFGSKSQDGSPASIDLPQPPSADSVSAKASDISKKKKSQATQSIYTSPLGVAGEAGVARKVLLGQ